MIRVVHPGSGSRILIFYPSRIPDPGVKKAPDPGSATQTGSKTDLGCEPDDPDLPFLADPVAPVLGLQYKKFKVDHATVNAIKSACKRRVLEMNQKS